MCYILPYHFQIFAVIKWLMAVYPSQHAYLCFVLKLTICLSTKVILKVDLHVDFLYVCSS